MNIFTGPSGLTGESFTRRKEMVFLLMILLVTMIVYSNSLFNGFVWDDHAIIVANPDIRSFKSIYKILTSIDMTYSDEATPYYRPLNRLSYLLDYHTFRLNPLGYHAVNLLLHAANALLVYFLARRLFKEAFPAMIAALLFAVHPINAEVVNFVSGGRNTLLAFFFAASALLLYLHGKEGTRHRLMALSGIAFLLALLCKETALMLPLFLFVWNVFGTSSLRQSLGSLVPHAIAICLYLGLRITSMGTVVGTGFSSADIIQRLANNLYIIPKYVLVLLWPVQLNNLYRFDEHYLAYWHVLISIAVIVLMVLLFRTGEPAVRFGLIWLAVNYLPISNIVPFPSAPMAERYMYLPGLGLWLVLAGLIHRLFLRVSWKSGVICGCLVIIALLGLRTWLRNPDWKNDGTLFSSLVKVDPDSASGHFNLGNYYKDIDLALAQIEWEKSVALEPRNSRAWNQLGTVHLLRGEIEAAESNYLRALREKPGDAEAHYNLATLYERRNMTAQALEQYQLYLRTAPNEHAAIISRVIDKVRAMQSLH